MTIAGLAAGFAAGFVVGVAGCVLVRALAARAAVREARERRSFDLHIASWLREAARAAPPE